MIYLRYIFPLISDLMLIIVAFIPCFRYSLDSEKHEPISLFELLGNAWNDSRKYLFSAQTTQSGEGVIFYRTVFATMLILLLLFIISMAIKIFSLSAAYPLFRGGMLSESEDKRKRIYVTFIPNRAILLILELLSLPILLFPNLLVRYYRRLLLYLVTIDGYSIIPLIFGIALWVVSVILTILAKPHEIKAKVDIFAKKAPPVPSDEDTVEPIKNDNKRLYRTKQTSSAEQDDRIRKMLDPKNKK